MSQLDSSIPWVEARFSADDRPVDSSPSAGAAGTLYLTLIKSVGHPELLSEFERVHGKPQGEILLSNQFGQIFEEARVQANVVTESFQREQGAGHITAVSADQAETLAEAMLRITEQQNAAIPNLNLHKKIVAAIVPAPAAMHGRELQIPPAVQNSVDAVDALTRHALPSEIVIADAVYQALSAERRRGYAAGGERARDPAGLWRKQVVAPVLSRRGERCVLVIDMARFSRIQRNMVAMRADGGDVLDEQIKQIISEGFKRAVASSHERYMYEWGGDGGTFFFDDPAVAHKVAVELLKVAEERNRRSRQNHFDDGMRCFRIGLDFGMLSPTGTNQFGGEAITRSTRLQTGGPSGEIRASAEFYTRLPDDLRRAYGAEEPVLGKGHDEPIAARRLAVCERATWAELDRDNRPFPPIQQPNTDFVVVPETSTAEHCFVVCPLTDAQPRVQAVFDRLIAPVCEKAGFTARRANDIPGDRKAIIADNLMNAPLVIAYLGDPAHGWNNNVILEVGFRLATGLPLVMLSDAMPDGSEPEYQRLLPFQVAHHNVITIGADPATKVTALERELTENRNHRATTDWESPNPMIEFKFVNVNDVVITDANEAARALFGAENVRKHQKLDKFRGSLLSRAGPAQAEARKAEFFELLTRLWQRSMFGDTMNDWKPPRARYPIVFNDAPNDPQTNKPVGYLPIVLRYICDQHVTRMRYLYLRVSASMTKDPAKGIWVCEV